MPRPLFIICCESRVVDKTTNLITIVNVIEGFQFSSSKYPVASQKLASPGFVGVAVWMREDGDNPNDEYEYETALTPPGANKEQIAQAGTVKFKAKFHRFETTIAFGDRLPKSSGVFLVESRIRRKGASEWLRQNFPVTFEVHVHQETPDSQQEAVEVDSENTESS